MEVNRLEEELVLKTSSCKRRVSSSLTTSAKWIVPHSGVQTVSKTVTGPGNWSEFKSSVIRKKIKMSNSKINKLETDCHNCYYVFNHEDQDKVGDICGMCERKTEELFSYDEVELTISAKVSLKDAIFETSPSQMREYMKSINKNNEK